MKNFLIILALVSLFSCSEEMNDFQNKDESTINYTETKAFFDPLLSLEYDEERFKIELISYLIGRTLINNSFTRTQFTSLSMSNNDIITINSLFKGSNFSKFRDAFQLEYYRFWISLAPDFPGDEGFGIEPLEFAPGRGGPGRSIITLFEYEEMIAAKYVDFFTNLSTNNCLELYFPIPLNFNINNLRITTVVARFNSTFNQLHGGELYRSEYKNEGNVVLLNRDYINEISFNDNNLLVVRPFTDESGVNANNCEYPFY